MLDRVLSTRRGPQVSEEGDEEDDESKRKHISLVMRATNVFTRTGTGVTVGYLWPSLIITIILLAIVSLFINSRDLVCVSLISNFDLNSRLRFFGLDGPDSDFGSLGVPWCAAILGCIAASLANGNYWTLLHSIART